MSHGLDNIVLSNLQQERLKFSSCLEEAVSNAEAVFIAVGTPSRRGDGHADLSYVYQATREIAAALKGFTVVITKSTVPRRDRRRSRKDHQRDQT